MASNEKKAPNRNITQNKKAWHDYFVDENFEAGIELFGTEVKSLRQGAVNLKDSYCSFKNGEIFALGVHISPYEQGNIFNKDPLRPKKLLMHKKEIIRLSGKAAEKGFSVMLPSAPAASTRTLCSASPRSSVQVRERAIASP